MRPVMKKVLLEFVHMLAASVFVGISVYGIFIYWGGETREKIPVSNSLLLGLGAVICVVIFVTVGGLLDRIAAASESGRGPEPNNNG